MHDTNVENKMNYEIVKRYILLIVLIGCICYTCDAPRYNPLDPKNPENHLVLLSGQIETISLPRITINNADVYWQDGDRLIQTDSEGYFRIENIVPNDGWLRFSKMGYLDDSLYIEWSQDSERHVNIYLNNSPQLDSLLIYSIILNRYPNIQVLSLAVEACITDSDNDIDTVYVENHDLNFDNFLFFDVNQQIYKRTFSMSDLGIITAEAVIGHEFHIIVKDKLGNRIPLDKMSVKRIIKEQVNLISPGSHDIVSPTPALNWEPLTPGFTLKYDIEIYTDDIEPQLVWQKRGLAQNTSTIEVDQSLPAPVDYFWIIWAVDEFNNRSRSRPKSFRVE